VGDIKGGGGGGRRRVWGVAVRATSRTARFRSVGEAVTGPRGRAGAARWGWAAGTAKPQRGEV